MVVSLEGAAQPATLTVTFRDERYQVQGVAEAAGTQETVAIPWPARLNVGLVFADVVLGDAEGTLDWGTVTFDVPRPVAHHGPGGPNATWSRWATGWRAR